MPKTDPHGHMKKIVDQKNYHRQAADDILAAVKKSGRDKLTADEAEAAEAHMAQFKYYAAQEQSVAEDEALVKHMKKTFAMGPGDQQDFGRKSGPLELGRIRKSLAQALQSKTSYGFQVPMSSRLAKAAITAGGGVETSGGGFDNVPGSAVTALRDLLDVQQVETGFVKYWTIGKGQDAQVVEEGETKPELQSDLESHTAELKKLATWFAVTDELSEDANFVFDFVLSEAYRSVLRAENKIIVKAFDDASGALTETGARDAALDVLATAIGNTSADNGLQPSAIVLNPRDLAAIQTAKADSAGIYHVDPLADGPVQIHGVEVAPTPAVEQGKLYLVTEGAGVFYETRRGLRVESGFTGDDWIRNKVTTRVEERVLPALVRPSLITRVTLED